MSKKAWIAIIAIVAIVIIATVVYVRKKKRVNQSAEGAERGGIDPRTSEGNGVVSEFPIKFGNRTPSAKVKELQRFLNQYVIRPPMAPLVEDGIWGNNTRQALITYGFSSVAEGMNTEADFRSVVRSI